MTPEALADYLHNLVEHDIKFSTMIWGPPGVGKSSIVAQVAAAHGLDWIDVRLSQLAPTDLRGLPVPEDGVSRWYPPEFLPRAGQGILFLDELNMAPPAMQGMAQQLILDRKVGSYAVPDDWFIWAAGNRKEDRASVFDMPTPLANRFVHLVVEPDFESFKRYALANGGHERILAFLSYRPALLHAVDPHQPAWPSPRSWMMASRLIEADMDIAPVVGLAAASEYVAYTEIYERLPDVAAILAGRGAGVMWPAEPSVRYATIIALTVRAADVQERYTAFRWLADQATTEWAQLFASDLIRLAQARGELGPIAVLAQQDPRLRAYLAEYLDMLGEG